MMYQAVVIGLGGFAVLVFLCRFIDKALSNRVHTHVQMIINKVVWYGGLILLLTMVLSQLGFNLTALLGAAGIAGAAVGFASKTSVSNIISGLFLLLESPFKVGDQIQVGSSTGRVKSIDLLSIQLQTPENNIIRLPNELLIKSPIVIKNQ